MLFLRKLLFILGILFSLLALCILVGVSWAWMERESLQPSIPRGTIRTEINIRDNRVYLFALGDTGKGNQSQKEVALMMEELCLEKKPDGILLLGDNFYMSGVVSVKDPQWKTKWKEMYHLPCLATVNFYPVFGNHDYRRSPQAQINYSLIDHRWKFPHRFYRVDFGNTLRLIAVDSSLPDFCFDSEKCTLDFLREEIAESKKAFTLAFAHHPLESSNSNQTSHGGRNIRSFAFRKLVCNSKLDGWLSGHSHHLEHLKDDSCNPDTFISGGGGAELYSNLNLLPSSLFAKASHGVLTLDINQESMDYRFIDIKKRTLYKFSRQKNPGNSSGFRSRLH